MDRQGDRAGRRRRKRIRPSIEGLEAREVLSSVIPILMDQVQARSAIRAAAGGAGGSGGAGTGGSTPTTLADLGTPTPRELARESFSAAFSGPYLPGPPRFVGQARQLLVIGNGSSSSFLHGSLQLGLFLPTDASQPITGTANLLDRNSSNTGNILGLDLQGNVSDVDRAGRPLHLTWTVNSSSGGTFSGAIGQGTLDIRYLPGLQRHHGGGAGTAQTLFKGRIYVTGVSDITKFNLNTI